MKKKKKKIAVETNTIQNKKLRYNFSFYELIFDRSASLEQL